MRCQKLETFSNAASVSHAPAQVPSVGTPLQVAGVPFWSGVGD
jgi:hypothetical protein